MYTTDISEAIEDWDDGHKDWAFGELYNTMFDNIVYCAQSDWQDYAECNDLDPELDWEECFSDWWSYEEDCFSIVDDFAGMVKEFLNHVKDDDVEIEVTRDNYLEELEKFGEKHGYDGFGIDIEDALDDGDYLKKLFIIYSASKTPVED